MAKKTEEQLRGLLKMRDNRKFYVDTGKGESRTTTCVYKRKDNKLIEELRNYHPVKSINAKSDTTNHISSVKFSARFEDESLPQDDEIKSISFMPIRNSEDVHMRITFIPKKETYLEWLIGGIIEDEPFIITFKDSLGNDVITEKFTLTKMSHYLVYPITIQKECQSIFIDTEELTYTVDFWFKHV